MTENQKEFMTIDGRLASIEGEVNVLDVIRKMGIEMPTFCYHSELSIFGACRMCVVEVEGMGVQAACSTRPEPGMVIKTNTLRLQKHRKTILELLLSNHCRDCTTCDKNGKCKLQALATRFGIRDIRFNNLATEPEIDDSSVSIVRDESKCILCGDCVRMCSEVQNVGAIDFAYRGSKVIVCGAFGEPLADTNCVNCGQCAAVCPTGAITVRNDCDKIWAAINDESKHVIVQVAPAVRVAMGEEFGIEEGTNVMDKIVPALRHIGFDEVFDTTVGADLTVMEESREFLNRLEKGENLPLFTSCCPAWVKHAETKHPDMVKNISTCRSPQQMFGAVLKEHYRIIDQAAGKETVTVAVMPCTAKKFEAGREEFKRNGVPDVDYVITTQELIMLINRSGLVFNELEPEATDMPFGLGSGAGVIFGVTGGVTEAVIRKISRDKSVAGLQQISFLGVRGLEGVKEAIVPYGDREVRIAVVSGLKNADDLIKKIKSGEAHYDLVEVMACPNGCISGAGQPFALKDVKAKRGQGLYKTDKLYQIKRSEENPVIVSMYAGMLKGKTKELLHVHYGEH